MSAPARCWAATIGGGRLALVGRGAGDDARHAGDLGGDHRHVGGGDHRVLAARHVAADRVHRDVLVAEHDAWQRLDLDVLERRALLLGEVPDLRLGELDVLDRPAGKLGEAVPDLLVRQPVVGAVPAVELDREIAHRRVAARLDVGERLLDDRAGLRVVRGDLARVAPLLQPTSHGDLPECGFVGRAPVPAPTLSSDRSARWSARFRPVNAQARRGRRRCGPRRPAIRCSGAASPPREPAGTPRSRSTSAAATARSA